MIKTLRKLRIEGNFKLIMALIKCLSLANIIINSERLNAMLLQIKKDKNGQFHNPI